jgi:hypothetical protein
LAAVQFAVLILVLMVLTYWRRLTGGLCQMLLYHQSPFVIGLLQMVYSYCWLVAVGLELDVQEVLPSW